MIIKCNPNKPTSTYSSKKTRKQREQHRSNSSDEMPSFMNSDFAGLGGNFITGIPLCMQRQKKVKSSNYNPY